MSLPPLAELLSRADASARSIPVAIPGAADATVLGAFRRAADRGWVEPILIGPEVETRRLAHGLGISLDGFAIRDVDGGETQAAEAVALVRRGSARLIAKGQIATPSLMTAVLDPEHGLRSGRVVSQVVLMEIEDQGRRFLLADTGINLKPKLASKIEITGHAIEVAHALGLDRPRVALVTASESVNPTMPETTDAAEIGRRNREGELFPDASVEGPLSFDLAYSSDAGSRKRIEGEVVGRADALIFPDLLSANLTVKGIMYTARCRFGGVLQGTSAPVAFMSRADSVATRLDSLALALAILVSK